MKKSFSVISILITLAVVITYIFIAPDIKIIGDNFFQLATIGLIISLILALFSEKGVWKKVALVSFASAILLFGVFVIVIRIIISGP